MLDNYIENSKEEIIDNLIKLINIPSIDDVPVKNKPFGENCNNALEYMLDLGKKIGFRTKNIDGYCGYIECGKGEELIGIIGHLDVVPAGDGWTYSPFAGEIHENRIYGRGTIDDKGPVIASLYAMKAIMENIKLNKRVRLILGLNEEKDWKGIERYKRTEELPKVSFSPDADFPCIYAEKAFLSLYLSEEYKENKNIMIEKIYCKNNPINVVPRFCEIILKTKDTDKVKDIINNIIKEKQYTATLNELNEEHLQIISEGISAHASHPELGRNAISMMLDILNEIIDLNIIKILAKNIGMDYNGNILNINHKDFSGELTLNVGDLKIEEDKIKIGINIRIPVETPINEIIKTFEKMTEKTSIEIKVTGQKEALNIPKDDFLVKTLCKVFNEKTNRNAEPFTMGGATYARAFKNCVSFGPAMPGDEDLCHQADENIKIDNLILCTKIYAQAIKELLLE